MLTCVLPPEPKRKALPLKMCDFGVSPQPCPPFWLEWRLEGGFGMIFEGVWVDPCFSGFEGGRNHGFWDRPTCLKCSK